MMRCAIKSSICFCGLLLTSFIVCASGHYSQDTMFSSYFMAGSPIEFDVTTFSGKTEKRYVTIQIRWIKPTHLDPRRETDNFIAWHVGKQKIYKSGFISGAVECKHGLTTCEDCCFAEPRLLYPPPNVLRSRYTFNPWLPIPVTVAKDDLTQLDWRTVSLNHSKGSEHIAPAMLICFAACWPEIKVLMNRNGRQFNLPMVFGRKTEISVQIGKDGEFIYSWHLHVINVELRVETHGVQPDNLYFVLTDKNFSSSKNMRLKYVSNGENRKIPSFYNIHMRQKHFLIDTDTFDMHQFKIEQKANYHVIERRS